MIRSKRFDKRRLNGGTETISFHGQTNLTGSVRSVMAVRRKIGFLLLTLLFGLSLNGALHADKGTPPEKIKVLLVDGQNNHDWQGCSPVMIDTLEVTGRFTVERVTVMKGEVADFNPEFTKYYVILSNYNGEPWMRETRAAFVKYIEEGGSLVVVHAADNSFPEWKEYNAMIGLGGWGGRNEKDGPYVYWKEGGVFRDQSKGEGGSHGRSWTYKVVVRDKEHPITRGLPKEFLQVKEELYDRLRGPAENMSILATALAKGGSERHEPVLMTIAYGEGRVFHTVMGHDHRSMQGVAFQETFIRGTEWAATGKVTFPPVSQETLPVNRAVYRHPLEIKLGD